MGTRHQTGITVLLISWVALFVLSGCGGAPEAAVNEKSVMATQVVAESMSEPVAEGAPALPTPAPMATPSPASGPPSAPGLAAPVQRMIIKNAEMDLLVADTDVALDSITVMAADYGGYIVSSHVWHEQELTYATVRLGVPVTEFENVLRRLRGLAIKVNSELASGEDVTDQFVDLQSRLTNLQATQARIREFLDQAQTVEEALKVNEQLSQVEAQIEEIQGRMNYLSDRAAFSTIDITLGPQRPTPTPTPTPTPEAWQPGQTFDQASQALVRILETVGNMAIWIMVLFGPFLIPAALTIWIVLAIRRRRSRHSKAGSSPPESEKEA